ncbi:MAG TPA: PQQ-binding-like beta-propeller repeat protein, partial [Vicinamibacteria bacterium]|nr:PQQ-binding-like beta-propeller repeat protein [Vicinamibacteria bacterium]
MKKVSGPVALLCLGVTVLACGSPSSGEGAATTTTVPSEWPMYSHDPGHTNTNPQEVTLSPAGVSALGPIFQVNIGSHIVNSFAYFSNSTPTISGGTVYVGSATSTGNNFFAFNAATGAALWAANLGYAYADACGPFDNVGIPSTAAVSGNILAVGGGDGAYYGVDAGSGAVLWRVPLNAGGSGYSWSSPVILGQRVYWGVASQCDNPPVRGRVQVVNLASGNPVGQQFFGPPGGRGGGVWNS